MKNRGKLLRAFFQLFLSYALSVLTVMCFLDGFGLVFSPVMLCLVSFIFICLVFGFFFVSPMRKNRKTRIFILLIILLSVLLYLLLFFKQILFGFTSIIDEVRRAFTQYYGGIFRGKATGAPDASQVTFAGIFMVILESIPICYVIRRGGYRWIMLVSGLSVAMLPFLAGLIMGNGYLLFYIICLFPVFTTGGINRKKRILRTSLQMLVFGVTVLCLLLAVAICPRSWYDSKFNAEETKQKIQESTYKIESQLFRKIFHSMEDSASYAGGLNKGELGWVDEIKYSNKSALEITVPEEVKESKCYSMFFRSYVGEAYESNRFSALGRGGKLEKSRLDKKYGRDTGELISVDAPDWWAKGTVSIKNIWAGEDYFAPYACDEEVGYDRDGNIKYGKGTKDNNQYSISCYYQVNDRMNNILDAGGNDDSVYGFDDGSTVRAVVNLIDGFPVYGYEDMDRVSGRLYHNKPELNRGTVLREIEMEYRDFAYKYDLMIPQNICDRTVKAFQGLDDFGENPVRKAYSEGNYDIYKHEEKMSLKQISYYIGRIKGYLDEKTEYSLKPGHLPVGEDFTEYFLFQGKEGYCTYYAATATIAFRSLGIPARYVEGFKASKQDIDNARNNGDGTYSFILKDVNAHAWVEIYIDGYGWHPVEVTPGYEQNSNAESIEGMLESKPSPGSTNGTEGQIGLGEDEDKPEEFEPDEDEPDEYDPYSFGSPSPAPEDASPVGTKTGITILICILTAVLLAAAGLVMLGLRRMKIRKKLNNPVLAKRALYLYCALEKELIKKAHINSISELLDKTVGEIKLKDSGQDLSGELSEIQRIGEKACFSGKDISKEEWARIRELCGEVKKVLDNPGKLL